MNEINKESKDVKTAHNEGVDLQRLVRCEGCSNEYDLKHLKRYRATEPNGEQANIRICQECVGFYRLYKGIRLKPLSI